MAVERQQRDRHHHQFIIRADLLAYTFWQVIHHHHLDYTAPIPPNFIRVLHRGCVRAVRVGKQARARRAEAMVPVQGRAGWALLSIRFQRDSIQHEKSMAVEDL